MMKILMVCTHPDGGATIAARRQAEALRTIGETCLLVSIREDYNTSNIEVIRTTHEIIINVPASSWSYSGRITSAYCKNNRTDISNTWFSFWPYETFLDQALLDICLDFDVIHFHWFAQMVSSRLLARLAVHGRRIVFTGHDMNHFTGGCHYSAGCERYRQECNDCPQLLVDPLNLVTNSFHQKTAAFAALSATWIFPSIWLADAFRQSKIQDVPAATIVLYNCIDTNRFFYLSAEERRVKREALGYASNERVIVAGAVDNTEMRKGFDYIESGLQHLASELNASSDEKRHYAIVTFGSGEPAIASHSPYVRHIHLGTINESQVVTLFQSSDLLLFPSLEENFSNTILESLLCGCPVFAFNIGGVPDIVKHETNGWIVDNIAHHNFATEFVNLVQSDKFEELRLSTYNWCDKMLEQYSYQKIACELLEVYKDTNAVTRPRVFSPPASLTPTIPLYKALFNKVSANDTNSHSLLAANIARRVPFAKGENKHLTSAVNLFSTSAIYFGFSNVSMHKTLGHVAWLMNEGHVFFKVKGNERPALCIQVPNIDWVVHNLNIALISLSATTNGMPAKINCVSSKRDAKYIYLWIIPETESLVPDVYNTLSFSFRESRVSRSKDPHGLRILHNQVTLIDLNMITSDSPSDILIADFDVSTALALKADQSHYLWQNWTEERNAEAALLNSMEAWIDLLQDDIETVEAVSWR